MDLEQKKNNLVYVLHDIEIGGAEVALLSAIPRLNLEYNLSIIVLGHVNESLIRCLSPDEKRVFTAFNIPSYLLPFRMSEVTKFIFSLKPDKLVCSLWRASWVGVKMKMRMPGIRFYSFIHNTRYFHYFDRRYTRLAIQSADIILVDSGSAKEFVKDELSGIKDIRIVSFLTDRSPQVNRSIHKAQTFSDRAIKFVFLGSIHKVKNLPLAIRLIAALQDRGYNILFDIYGRPRDGYTEALELVKEMKLENIVKFKGQINPCQRFAVLDLYDFYLQLSHFEGMAMSVVEAMQYGLVCVVTAVGEIPNYAEDGKSAIFVYDQNDQAWYESISKVEKIINDPGLYSHISDRGFHRFSDMKCYAESLIKNLA